MENFGFQWHITDRCMGRCRHCYQNGFGGEAEQPPAALKEIASHIMSQLKAPVSINLTGGEPLLYNGLFELMDYLSSFSNLDELSLITSSYNMDSHTVKELKKNGGLTNVKISLESHIPAVNDSIRGAGHFEMAVNNISSLVRARIPVIIMVTLGSYNYGCVKGVCALASELGASGVIFERYVPLGRGVQLKDEVLNSLQWEKVLRSVCAVGDMDGQESALIPYKAFWVDVSQGLTDGQCSVSGAFCNLGSSSMALMPDGTVFPCRRLPVPAGRLPDISMERLLEILSQYSPHVLHEDNECAAHDCCALSRALKA